MVCAELIWSAFLHACEEIYFPCCDSLPIVHEKYENIFVSTAYHYFVTTMICCNCSLENDVGISLLLVWLQAWYFCNGTWNDSECFVILSTTDVDVKHNVELFGLVARSKSAIIRDVVDQLASHVLEAGFLHWWRRWNDSFTNVVAILSYFCSTSLRLSAIAFGTTAPAAMFTQCAGDASMSKGSTNDPSSIFLSLFMEAGLNCY